MTELKELLARAVDASTPLTLPPYDGVIDRIAVRRRRRRILTTAGGATLLVAGALIPASQVVDRPGDAPARQDQAQVRGPGSPEGLPDPHEHERGPLPFSGTFGCVETYDEEGPPRRAFAFDGTIVTIASALQEGAEGNEGAPESPAPTEALPQVTFEVHEWFRGGTGSEVTIAMWAPEPASDGRPASYSVGTRLLVSGEPRWGGQALDDAIAWGCGFTRYYEPQTAATWAGTGRSAR